jgi:hypothetical protein
MSFLPLATLLHGDEKSYKPYFKRLIGRHGEQSVNFAWPSRKNKVARLKPFYSKGPDQLCLQ